MLAFSCCATAHSCGLSRALRTPASRSDVAKAVVLPLLLLARRTVAAVDDDATHATRRPASSPFASVDARPRGWRQAVLLAAQFACPPAEARRPFCVSSAIPMAAALLPSGSAQSSQPRMTDHRVIRRSIPLAGRHRPQLALLPARWVATTTTTRCGEIDLHLPPLAVACSRRYAGVVVASLSFFWPVQSGAKNNV